MYNYTSWITEQHICMDCVNIIILWYSIAVMLIFMSDELVDNKFEIVLLVKPVKINLVLSS